MANNQQGFPVPQGNQFEDAMEQTTLEEELAHHEQQEQNAQARMANMENMMQTLQAQYHNDQQTILALQQQQRDNAATILDLQNHLQQQLHNPPAVAPQVAPAVPPAVPPAPVVQPTVNPAPQVQNTIVEKQPGEILRPPHPDKFDGDTSKLRQFLEDLTVHFEYYFPITFAPTKLYERIRYAGTRMEGAAGNWIQAIFKDRSENPQNEWQEQTRLIFTTYANFEDQLKKSFGVTNEVQEAEKKLRELVQKGPCYKYTSTFLQLLTKVNWTEESKKESYYFGLKSEVKDEFYKIPRDTTSFIDYTQAAIQIDNRQWERKQEKKAERNGNLSRYRPQANQGKKREEYVARDNGTRPGKMDIDTINQKKFTGECRACGKKGHKEADCRSKLTCTYCKKAGHKEADCYSKKRNDKNTGPREKVQVDSINETKHELLSWTACYDDACLIHKSDKEGTGYYPSKKQRPQKGNVKYVDSVVYREGRINDLGSDHESSCEYCGSYEPGSMHDCDQRPHLGNTMNDGYDCEHCNSWDPDHECHGCKKCGSMEGYDHFCEPEHEENIRFAYESDEEADKLARMHLEQQRQEELQQLRIRYRYTCEICKSHDLDHDCEGCAICGSWEVGHDCNEVLLALTEQHRRQEKRRQYLEENPPEQVSIR
jgi:hypothetical protein